MAREFKPKLSVITIVYNNARDLERTILSVINQSYAPIEYLIVDGGSTDGTLDIIKQYDSKINHWISEPDKGVYHAMNKGLAMATGEYVLFMNSGDEIYDSQTVEKVFSSQADADIYYGETEMFNEKGESLGTRRHRAPDSFNWRSFRYGMSICHQAIYIRRSLTSPYNETYKLSADIDWILKAAKKAKCCVRVPGYVAKYLVGGLSKKKHWQSLKERFAILSNYYGFLPNLFNHGVIALRLVKSILKREKAAS